MVKAPRHRPVRRFPEAKRLIIACELDQCPHCGQDLTPRKPWHMRKTVQTMNGPVFVAGKSKQCLNPACARPGQHYYATGQLKISLPSSTYGLDVLAFIGWQHDREYKQLVEIQQALNERGILINERTVGKLYRQFLALLGDLSEPVNARLAATAEKHGGLIWAMDALQPDGHGTLLYVLYEVLDGTPVAALPAEQATTDQLITWLQPYQALPYPVLATLSDGEEAIIGALQHSWPQAPHQRCQAHFLNNLVEPVLPLDSQLRQQLQADLAGLPKVPTRLEPGSAPPAPGGPAAAPLFCRQPHLGMPN